MPDESTPEPVEDVVARYFEADARRDIDAIMLLFRDDAVVIDEGRAWHGRAEIRQWRLGPASKYEYATTIATIDRTDDTHYRVSGRIDGNFPGATAELAWDFSTVGGLISRLKIAPRDPPRRASPPEQTGEGPGRGLVNCHCAVAQPVVAQ